MPDTDWQAYEVLPYDVVIVGAGPAGLATAIVLKERNADLQIAVLEKAPIVGGHTVSGAVVDTAIVQRMFSTHSGLAERLLQSGCAQAVLTEHAWYLHAKRVTPFLVPRSWAQAGCHIVKLGTWLRILAEYAEQLGVDVLLSASATEACVEAGRVRGLLVTGEDNQPFAVQAHYTVLAEGARGSVTQALMRDGFFPAMLPQTYALGIKECWQYPDSADMRLAQGTVVHTLGWPVASDTYAGGFLYQFSQQELWLGHVTGLDYPNPYTDPFCEMQRWKTHPRIRALLHGAVRVGYAARVLAEGGWQAMPTVVAPGALLVGCAAGLLDTARLKGVHHALHSGFLAATALADTFAARSKQSLPAVVRTYATRLQASPVTERLYRVRNVRPGFRSGRFWGMFRAGSEGWFRNGRSPWTVLWSRSDRHSTRSAYRYQPIDYPVADGRLVFTKTESVALSQTFHPEGHGSHLQLGWAYQLPHVSGSDPYAGMAVRYCPAGVYRYTSEKNGRVQLIADYVHCIHCKTCDIKDPVGSIRWTVPAGGGGPQYAEK